jgi:DNA-binding LacI/PurR family transcriptional regulator
MAVTMKDVAKAAGVSIKTVSNVLNDYAFIKPSTKQRVLTAITDLGYETNPSARSLRSGKTRILGLIVSDISVPFYAELAARMMTIASARGYRIIVEQSAGEFEAELRAMNGLLRHLTDGLLLLPLALDAPTIRACRADKPLVLLGEHILDDDLDLVTMRNVEAAEAATEHLLRGGHRRIAVLGADPTHTAGSAGLRLQGYRRALARASVQFDPEPIVPCPWYLGEGAKAMAALLESGKKLDAVFGLNDVISLGAMHELRVRGIRIPQDIAVVGFDDIEEAKFSSPALTTVSPGLDEIAEQAIRRLIHLIDQGDGREAIQIYANFELIVRSSAP